MPVRKFRSAAEMPHTPLPPLDPRNLKLACDLSAVAMRMRPVRVPAGVYKHRSLDDPRRRRAWKA